MKSKNKGRDYRHGKFGQWITDQFNLPAYKYTCMQTLDPFAATNTSGKDSVDHWHQVGNDRITLTAHNGGHTQFFIADRGMQWISYKDEKKNILGGGICIIEEDKSIWTDLYTSKSNTGESSYQRIFGCGYFQKILEKKRIKIDHIIYPPFGDDPVVLTEIKITNTSDQSRKITVYDFWGIKIQSLIGSLLAMLIIPKDRTKFGTTRVVNWVLRVAKNLIRSIGLASDQTRERFSSKFYFETSVDEKNNSLILTPKYKGKIPVKEYERADRNYFLDPIFLASYSVEYPLKFFNSYDFHKIAPREFNFQKSYQDTTGSTPCLMVGHELTIEPGESKSLKFIFGNAKRKRMADLVEKYKNSVSEHNLKNNFKLWKDNCLHLNIESDSWLSREAAWHSYYLRSAALFDSYYNNHYLPQGNAYTFLHGANGAVRDYALFLVPMIYFSPSLAREMLEYIYRTMTTEGDLPYALVGYGQNLGAIVHETSSDLHLFLLWGLLEYIYATRDFQFLDKKIPYYPLDCGKKSSVLDRIEISLKFLFRKVGIGEHGMIKVGSGDWSDGISLLVKNRGSLLKKGESTFNTAFALYVFPLLIDLLKDKRPKIAKFLNNQFDHLKKACQTAWNGRWFYRGWDGAGGPIGDRNLFLEHHPWLLLSNILSHEQSKSIIENIHKILDIPSKIGQFILYPPAKVMLNILPGGWDVNGGIWFAMNFLLTWAYSKYDKEKAYQSLLKNSMARRAEVYPDIWYGIWSGSDSYNADYPGVPNPGQTFIHPATPQTDFPIMNLNLHACIVGSIIKLAGINATVEGIEIDPKFPLKEFQFSTATISLDVSEKEIKGHYQPVRGDHCILKIKTPENWTKNIIAYVNGKELKEDFSIEGDWLLLKVDIPETGISFALKQQ